MRRSPAAVRPAGDAEQTEAFRVLFQQQGERLWNADRDIDWDRGAQIPDAKTRLLAAHHQHLPRPRSDGPGHHPR